MSGKPADGGYGTIATDEYLLRGIEQFREHLELLYPFAAVGVLSLFLELRLDVLGLLFDFDQGWFSVDTDVLETILSEPVAEQLTPVLEEMFVLLLLGVLGIVLLVVLALLLAVSIAFLVASDEHENRERTQAARARVALTRFPALFTAMVLSGILVAMGLVLLIAPGVYLTVKFALAGPAIVIDGHGPIGGLRASWRRASGQFATVAGILALSIVSLVVVGFIPLVGELLAVLVVLPVFALTIATLYVDTRRESEN